MVSVALRGISKRFGDTPVIDGISLDVNQGETFFIMGASGSGKTTLLRIIAGLESPDAGAVLFGSIDVTEYPVDLRRSAFVFQNYCLWPHMTVRENIGFGLEMAHVGRAECEKRIAEVCRLTQLCGFERRYPHELSGGQQQRVSLARALAPNPRVLLLDEPLSNLDARLRSAIRRELRELGGILQTTMIYVSHDFDDALNLADRVGYLERGRIAQVGTPRELYEAPASESAARFLGPIVKVPSLLHGRDGTWWARPEWLTMTPSSGGNGTVGEIEFDSGGAVVQVVLPDAAETVTVAVPLRDLAVSYGDRVTVSIDPRFLVTFPPAYR